MRYSTTLMERQLYSADLLPDGSVVRISDMQYTPLTLILGMIQPVIIIALLALLLSLLLASRMSKRIVRPLNELSLDNADRIETYPELEPLTDKLRSQQNQLREQETELRRRRDEFEAATGNMTEGLVLLNEQGSVLSINRSATHILDISRYCIGKDIRAVSAVPQLRELSEKALGGEHCEAHACLGGVSYRLYASPVTSGDKVSGAVLLMLDTTEKEQAEQLRREFSANVSHELKSPLHPSPAARASGKRHRQARGRSAFSQPDPVRGKAHDRAHRGHHQALAPRRGRGGYAARGCRPARRRAPPGR